MCLPVLQVRTVISKHEHLEGKARQVPVGRSFLQITTAEEAVEVGMRLLTENRYAFLLNPPRFREGQIPADGPTGPEKQVYYGPQ